MPRFAVCADPGCHYLYDFEFSPKFGLPEPPARCPKCLGKMIFACSQCNSPLLEWPRGTDPRCTVCDAPLRPRKHFHPSAEVPRALAKKRKSPVSGNPKLVPSE